MASGLLDQRMITLAQSAAMSAPRSVSVTNRSSRSGKQGHADLGVLTHHVSDTSPASCLDVQRLAPEMPAPNGRPVAMD